MIEARERHRRRKSSPWKLPPEDISLIQSLARSGLSRRDISKMMEISLGAVGIYSKGIKADPNALAEGTVAAKVSPRDTEAERDSLTSIIARLNRLPPNSPSKTKLAGNAQRQDNPSSPESRITPPPDFPRPPPVSTYHFYPSPTPPKYTQPFSVDAAIKDFEKDMKEMLEFKLIVKMHEETVEEIGDNYWEYDFVYKQIRRKYSKMISWMKEPV